MPLKDVILTKKVERHIEKHGVTREEIMDVFMCVRLSNPSIHQPLSIDIWIASLAEVNVV